ncbi:MAG TPA: extracellular solute-binding protein [Vicinamibacterales bacterium]|jgi:multiple sugar transport system substrate-binding protein|nr:extracellular solute-binding protein [Vicinamibacterales bacterium]
MSSRRRHAVTGVVVAALALAGAGCGDGDGGGEGPPRLQWYVNPDDGGQAEIGRRCTAKAQGRYRIETPVLPRSASDQREQLLRRLAAKDSSIDLMSLDPVFVPEFAEAEFLAPIPEGQARSLSEEALEPAVKGATWNGRLVAVPMWANTQVLWYRKSVVRKAGLDLETAPVTWARLIAAARSTGTTVAVQAQRYEGYTVLINALIESARGRIIENPGASSDNIELGIDSPAGSRSASIIRRLADSGVGGPSLSNADEEAARTLFQGANGGFMVNWPYVWRAANAAIEDGSLSREVVSDIGWARYPRAMSGAPSRPPLGGIDLGIGRWSEHAELALDAARCIASPENQTFYFLHDGNPAARASVYSDPRVLEAFPMAPLLRESLRASAPRPRTEFYGDLSAGLQREFHPPDAVTSNTPGDAQAFILRVLHGEDLL